MTITILDIIHSPAFYLKHEFSETEFCLLFQVEPIQMGQIERACSCLRTLATSEQVQPEDKDRIQFPKRRVYK
jgi:hypothetical protein